MQKIYCIMEALLSGNKNDLSHPNKQRFLPGPGRPLSSSPSSLRGLEQVVLPFCAHFFHCKLEGSDASHMGCWEDPVDNEPCFLLVQMTARAVQSYSHAQCQCGTGKMWSCLMCSNLLPAQTMDLPTLVGKFPTFCSKSKVVYLFSDIKNHSDMFINNRKAGKTRCPVTWSFPLTLGKDKKWGEDKHFNMLPGVVLEGRQVLQWWGTDKRLSWVTVTFCSTLQGYNCVPFF